MLYYVIIDTNVLVSAVIKHDSIPGAILDLAFEGPVIPVLNDTIENEYRAVLSREKFHLTEDIIDDIISSFHNRSIYVDERSFEAEFPDESDRVFYEVVMTVRDEEDAYLVTGNLRHVPVKPFIVSPRQLLGLILNDSEPKY